MNSEELPKRAGSAVAGASDKQCQFMPHAATQGLPNRSDYNSSRASNTPNYALQPNSQCCWNKNKARNINKTFALRAETWPSTEQMQKLFKITKSTIPLISNFSFNITKCKCIIHAHSIWLDIVSDGQTLIRCAVYAMRIQFSDARPERRLSTASH